MVKILMVCYSLPVNVKFSANTQTYECTVHNGGLQNGLQGVKDCSDYVWLGWPGDEIQSEFQADLRDTLRREHGFHAVFFAKHEFQSQYLSYCFLCLHPIKHNLVDRSSYKKSWWYSYARVNEKFAREVLSLVEEGDLGKYKILIYRIWRFSLNLGSNLIYDSIFFRFKNLQSFNI